MSPTQVIVAVMALGFVVLLVAPSVHRRNTLRSREAAVAARSQSARRLRDAGGLERRLDPVVDAVRVRDALILRGVRAEILRDRSGVSIVFDAADAETVDSVLAELSR